MHLSIWEIISSSLDISSLYEQGQLKYIILIKNQFNKIIMGLIEKIKEIEEEMARTQKNKATEYHMG